MDISADPRLSNQFKAARRLGELEADGSLIPVPAGGARDAFANAGEPGLQRDGIDHYFGSCESIAVAVAAFGPVGDSFRYALNSVAAPARLPSFTSAMPS